MLKDHENTAVSFAESICLTREIIERFWEKVEKGLPHSCWNWAASTYAGGYGAFGVRKGQVTCAHRIAFLICHGDFKPVQRVCHSCDNPLCCNPGHLFLGTAKDNTADMNRKGRFPKGEKRRCAKLRDSEVAEIKSILEKASDAKAVSAIAVVYGVSRTTIDDIKNGKSWKFIVAPPE